MTVLHFARGNDTRCINPGTRTCVFSFRGKLRTSRLGCATTYAVRLVEAGWKLQLVETCDR